MVISILNAFYALQNIRITGSVSKSFSAIMPVLIFSICTSVAYAQEQKATDTPVTLNAPDEAGLGSSVSIDWVGPNEKGDVIAVAEAGATINKTPTTRGTPLTVKMPATPGEYELRYILNQGRTVLATRPIKVNAVEVTLNAPDEAGLGSSVSVDWVGKTPTTRGTPLTVQMPATPGEYELRYILNQGRTVLATRPIKVTEAQVTLTVPSEASISSPVSVSWVGPGENGDVIALAKIGEKKTISKTAVRDNPLTVQMPVEPGEYELRYIRESVSINWVGRQVKGDVIALVKTGDKNMISPVYSPLQGPLRFKMPTVPGEYELRYMLYKNFTVLATKPITVKQVEITLKAPDEAIVGLVRRKQSIKCVFHLVSHFSCLCQQSPENMNFGTSLMDIGPYWLLEPSQ